MTTRSEGDDKGLAWQVGVWNRMSDVYLREIDKRFTPVVENVLKRARLKPGEQVVDIGTGTGSVALQAGQRVAPGGQVTGIDISGEMVSIAQRRAVAMGLQNVVFHQGRIEAMPVADGAADVALASLVLMYAIDRPAAARDIARVLRRGGRFVAAVWSGPADCDIVLFQQTAGRFAPTPPVPGVGPGALADTAPFLAELGSAGIEAHVERETLGFDFDDFASAWEVLAGVTTAQLPQERQQEARAAVQTAMWPDPRQPRHFRNVTQFIVGQRA